MACLPRSWNVLIISLALLFALGHAVDISISDSRHQVKHKQAKKEDSASDGQVVDASSVTAEVTVPDATFEYDFGTAFDTSGTKKGSFIGAVALSGDGELVLREGLALGNSGFEDDEVTPAGTPFQYRPLSEWIGQSTALLISESAPWGGLAAYTGEYYAAIQSKGARVQQALGETTADQRYIVTFAAASRPNYGLADLTVTVNDNLLTGLETITLTDEWQVFEGQFTGDGLEATIMFENSSPPGDRTVFLDTISVERASAILNGGFESDPLSGDAPYEYRTPSNWQASKSVIAETGNAPWGGTKGVPSVERNGEDITPKNAYYFNPNKPKVDVITGQEGVLYGDTQTTFAEGNINLSSGAHDGFYGAKMPFALSTFTLDAWVKIDNKNQRGGGSVAGIQTLNGNTFTGIVYAERKAREWMIGSDSFRRTQDAPATTGVTTGPEFVVVNAPKDGDYSWNGWLNTAYNADRDLCTLSELRKWLRSNRNKYRVDTWAAVWRDDWTWDWLQIGDGRKGRSHRDGWGYPPWGRSKQNRKYNRLGITCRKRSLRVDEAKILVSRNNKKPNGYQYWEKVAASKGGALCNQALTRRWIFANYGYSGISGYETWIATSDAKWIQAGRVHDIGTQINPRWWHRGGAGKITQYGLVCYDRPYESSVDWIHMAVTVAKDGMTLYRNGEVYIPKYQKAANPTFQANQWQLIMGTRHGQFSRHAKGGLAATVGHVNVWNTPLSADEISTIFNLGMVEKPGLSAPTGEYYSVIQRNGAFLQQVVNNLQPIDYTLSFTAASRPNYEMADLKVTVNDEVLSDLKTIKLASGEFTEYSGTFSPDADGTASIKFENTSPQMEGREGDRSVFLDTVVTRETEFEEGHMFFSGTLTEDITVKTLAVWVKLDNLEQRGGAAVGIQTGDKSQYDSIAYGDQDDKLWSVVSEDSARSSPGGGDEEANLDWIYLTCVWEDAGSGKARMTLYKNGERYIDPWVKGDLVTYSAGDAFLLSGVSTVDDKGNLLLGRIAGIQVFNEALSSRVILKSFENGLATMYPLPDAYSLWDMASLYDSTGDFDITLGHDNTNSNVDAYLEDNKLVLGKANRGWMKSDLLSSEIKTKTLECWVKLGSYLQKDGGSALTIQTEEGDVYDGIVFAEMDKRKWMAGSNDHERTLYPSSGFSETSLAWVHMVIVYDEAANGNAQITVYRNSEIYIDTYEQGELPTYAADKYFLTIGPRVITSSSYEGSLYANIDAATVWNEPLSSFQVKSLYLQGAVHIGVSIPVLGGKVLGALKVDGSTEYVQVEDPEMIRFNSTSKACFTVEAWVKPMGACCGSDNNNGLISKMSTEDSPVTIRHGFSLQMTKDKKIRVIMGNVETHAPTYPVYNDPVVDPSVPLGDAEKQRIEEREKKRAAERASIDKQFNKNHKYQTHYVSFDSTSAIDSNNWGHVAVVYDAGAEKAYLYLNGELDKKVNVTCGVDWNNDEDLIFGSTSFSPETYNWGGYLDEVRIWAVARSADEIADNYLMQIDMSDDESDGDADGEDEDEESDIDEDRAMLVGYWKMDSYTGTTVWDISGNEQDGTIINSQGDNWAEYFDRGDGAF